jgi:hypothetical protein
VENNEAYPAALIDRDLQLDVEGASAHSRSCALSTNRVYRLFRGREQGMVLQVCTTAVNEKRFVTVSRPGSNQLSFHFFDRLALRLPFFLFSLGLAFFLYNLR